MIKKIFLWFKKNEKVSFFILLIITGIIGYCSTLTKGPIIGPTFSWLATAYHFSIFFAFAFVLFLTVTEEKFEHRYLFLVIIFSLMVAFLDEIHQMIIPFRDASINDVMIDFCGSLFGILFFLFLEKQFKSRI